MNSISTRNLSPYVALGPILLGVFIAADDQTVVVTVLPQIMLDMKVTVTELDRASWTITGYLLGYLAAMPLIGRLSDVWGHRRMFALS
jgi:MFS family permease